MLFSWWNNEVEIATALIVIKAVVMDDYGIAAYVDNYLDVIFTPEDAKINDKDEIVHTEGELTEEQYK